MVILCDGYVIEIGPRDDMLVISIQSRLQYETLKITLKGQNVVQCNLLMLPITLKGVLLVKL